VGDSPRSPTGMVNFVCQLGWTMTPRHSVKHDSGCVSEGGFGWD
jgi:hypothetical protein